MSVEEIIDKVSSLSSFILDDDIKVYYKYANLINDGLIVDLGTGWGKSMISLALSNPSNEVITCDPGNYPIAMNWAKNGKEYTKKIEKLVSDFGLDNVDFYLGEAEELVEHELGEIDILHIDNWSEINSIDSTDLLKAWISKVKKGGYLLFRNYDRGDREFWTSSINNVTNGLKRFDELGLVAVFQK